MNKKKPIIVGITGGIGSGKTTVAKHFEKLGFPLYNSDLEARNIQNSNPEVIHQIKTIFGEEAYNTDGLNRIFIANQVFNNKEKIKQLNNIVHPAVFEDFKNWVAQQNNDILFKEAAILIESGSYKDCDLIISVIADLDVKIDRIIKRDNFSKEQILARMTNQLKDEERVKYSDFIIDNSKDLDYLYQQVENIADKIKNNINFEH